MNLSILIVDNEKTLCDCMRIYLNSHGFQVESVYSAQQALAKLDQKAFDVVICDVCLPKISGVAILKMLKTRYPLTTVIMTTGYTSKEIAAECLAAGAYDFLFKPFHLDLILRALEEVKDRQKRWEDIGVLTKES